MRIPTPDKYNFAVLTALLSRFRHPALDVVREGALWRVLRIGAGLALVRISADAAGLMIEIVARRGAVDEAVLGRRLRWMLALDVDSAPFYAAAEQDATLQALIAPLRGLPMHRTPTTFEALVLTIIEQHISWVAAQAAQVRLVQWAGDALMHADRAHYAMPTPQQLAAASLDDLLPLKITRKRMALLMEVARAVVAGDLPLAAWTDPATLYDRLLAIKGIGHWTAAVTVSRALGVHPYVPHNDVVLQTAVNRYFHGGQGRTTPAVVKATFARYGEHAGTAAHFTMMRYLLDNY